LRNGIDYVFGYPMAVDGTRLKPNQREALCGMIAVLDAG
jgi:hypothetical protein